MLICVKLLEKEQLDAKTMLDSHLAKGITVMDLTMYYFAGRNNFSKNNLH